MKKLIILDRDGVINEDRPDFVKTEDEWIPIPGSLEAIAQLTRAGFTIVVATNQSGVARKLYSLETLSKIHQKMQHAVESYGGKIDNIYVCPHETKDNCSCRKPKAGLFEQIEATYQIKFSLTHTPAIGDSLRDLEAALTAGCRPILVLTGNGQTTKQNLPLSLQSIDIFPDLYTAVQAICHSGLLDNVP